MKSSLPVLQQVQIAAPCDVPWEQMLGDDRVRHCAQCDQSVYDVTMLTEREATELITSGRPRVCLRLYRRGDGRIVTRDCWSGRMLRWRRRWHRAAWAVFSWCGLAALCGCQDSSSGSVNAPEAKPVATAARRRTASSPEPEKASRVIELELPTWKNRGVVVVGALPGWLPQHTYPQVVPPQIPPPPSQPQPIRGVGVAEFGWYGEF